MDKGEVTKRRAYSGNDSGPVFGRREVFRERPGNNVKRTLKKG